MCSCSSVDICGRVYKYVHALVLEGQRSMNRYLQLFFTLFVRQSLT